VAALEILVVPFKLGLLGVCVDDLIIVLKKNIAKHMVRVAVLAGFLPGSRPPRASS
jgi:hypothetical protein